MWGGDQSAGGLLDPDGAYEQIARWREQVEQMASNTQAMSDRLREARESAADANRLVEVTVDSTGRLVDLRLGERSRNVSPDMLARTIMQTIDAAAEKMGERAQQIITETMGPDSVAGREIASRVVQQLQTPDRPAERGDDRQRW